MILNVGTEYRQQRTQNWLHVSFVKHLNNEYSTEKNMTQQILTSSNFLSAIYFPFYSKKVNRIADFGRKIVILGQKNIKISIFSHHKYR